MLPYLVLFVDYRDSVSDSVKPGGACRFRWIHMSQRGDGRARVTCTWTEREMRGDRAPRGEGVSSVYCENSRNSLSTET